MTPERWERAKEVVQGAWEHDVAERGVYLDEACAGDQEMRAEVESLLASDQNASGFLATPVRELIQQATLPEYWAGRRLGAYQMVREIGHGGMGTVYLAERADGEYRMQVAIKLVSPHLCTEAVLRRFRTERQVEASLDHPNITRLLDGGTTDDGLPYLVMEYVDGVRIDAWCDSRKLSVRDRLKLFRQVCAAVQSAHEKEIVHRDIKPGNILVTADGTIKLLDFGISKVLNRELFDTPETTLGETPMTPEYASPEQIRGLRVGPATDIYSLGVVLYQLLTGSLPFASQREQRQVMRAICEEEPLKPSAAIHQETVLAGQQGMVAETTSQARGESPTGLRRLLSGDLDNIVLKALRKEPERRYPTVRALSEDLDRFLQDLPVEARKDSLPYRSLKFLKRNRALITVGMISAVLVLAVDLGSRKSSRYNLAPDNASIAVLPFADISPGKDQKYFAEDLTDGLLGMLASIPGLRLSGRESSSKFQGSTQNVAAICKALNVSAVLDASIGNEGGHAKINAHLRAADGRQLWAGTYNREANEIFAVQEEMTQAIAVALNLKPPKRTASPSMTTTPAAYRLFLQGEYFRDQGNVPQAISYFEQTLGKDRGYAPAWVALADAHAQMAGGGTIPAAEGYGKAREELESALALNPHLAEAHALKGYIKMLHERDWPGADASVQRALALAPGSDGAIRIAAFLARILGRLDEAIVLCRRAVELNPIYYNSYKNLGITLYYAGRPTEATGTLQKALELNPKTRYAHAYLCLANLAESRPQEGLTEAEKELNPGYRLSALAMAYQALGERAKSDASLRELIAEQGADLSYQVAEVYAFRGEKELAFQWLDRAYAQNSDSLPEMKADPLFADIRSDARYSALLQKLRLPQ
uniref:Serine/threonine protein kinase with TPR repeats n=1 Tax=Solibacter usitatus (strain Ellin6076) TaxID=234267 RepID=Q029D0_SOLUE